MKRHNHIFEKIIQLDNIKDAIWKSSKGKRDQRRVRKILSNVDGYAREIRRMLISKTYKPSPYTVKTITDSSNLKTREIHKPQYYPDQIIHWAMMIPLVPIFSKGMYEYNCGSVPGRGTAYGQKAIRKWLDRDKRNTKYCLKMDIKKFYPSTKNGVLKQAVRRKIKDKNCLWLLDRIIESSDGLPIGNYTSPWLSNLLLEPLDHYIKEKLKVKYYVRYVDDLVLFGANKKKLHTARKRIAEKLSAYQLSVKQNWQVFRTDSRPIDFLGLRFYRTHTTLRRRNALRIMRRMKKIHKKGHLTVSDAQAVLSYWGWLKCSDSFGFYHEHVKLATTIKEAERKVSIHAKIRHNRRKRAALAVG